MWWFFCVSQGYVQAGTEQCLRVLYLPGVPEVFKKQLQLKVAFLPPQDITLTGEGVFPRISLNLPKNLCTHCTLANAHDRILTIRWTFIIHYRTFVYFLLANITNGVCNRLKPHCIDSVCRDAIMVSVEGLCVLCSGTDNLQLSHI